MKARLAALAVALALSGGSITADDSTHATRGTVTAAGPSEIVVAKAKNRGQITITLAPDTHIDGTIRTGAIVSVRYREDHGRHVATAVSVERPH
jgi:hypothetical protein